MRPIFLSFSATLDEERNELKEKFVIKKFDVGLENLKEEVKKAKTVEIDNATADFIKRVEKYFRSDAAVRVLLFQARR